MCYRFTIFAEHRAQIQVLLVIRRKACVVYPWRHRYQEQDRNSGLALAVYSNLDACSRLCVISWSQVYYSGKLVNGMVAHLKGVLDRVTQDSLILDVNGIGFRVFTATGTLAEVGIGELIRVYTHTYVREDILALYGFLTESELRMFEQLLAISGVGPKAALALISAVSPSAFGLAVLTEDADSLTKAQGIGKKTAQRIILELKDKIRKEQAASGVVPGTAQISRGAVPEGIFGEAAGALMMLGYSASEAQKSVSAVMEDGKPLESVIRDALKMRGKVHRDAAP